MSSEDLAPPWNDRDGFCAAGKRSNTPRLGPRDETGNGRNCRPPMAPWRAVLGTIWCLTCASASRPDTVAEPHCGAAGPAGGTSTDGAWTLEAAAGAEAAAAGESAESSAKTAAATQATRFCIGWKYTQAKKCSHNGQHRQSNRPNSGFHSKSLQNINFSHAQNRQTQANLVPWCKATTPAVKLVYLT